MADMDEVERGFEKLVERVKAAQAKREELTGELKKKETVLLSRMIKDVAPLIPEVGLILLKKGKEDTKGEIFDTVYYKEKMLVLGKTDPAEYRPDDINKKVVNQFLVLHQDGSLYELMYSSDGVLIDSYLNPLRMEDAIQIYGYEILLNIFRFLKDYHAAEESLVSALESVLSYLSSGV
ncbi:MAG: hypothetical protein QHG99_08245 [Methanomicrobiales archaeon]|nr:hypothetical protein [Methanomicrobiales archaeon]